ncbi:type VII secretion target [Mycolicibacterium vaccae]|uniref:type VII secretion target n=1 Tax=Mycolicibacterium vaccae TaxID=1810 RepID=UPI003CEDB679
MYARLSVETELVRRYGSASSAHAADLHDVARRLSGVGTGAAAMFGPVGARFLTTLTHAAAGEAAAVGALSGTLAGARAAAQGAAAAYETVDADTGVRVTGFW